MSLLKDGACLSDVYTKTVEKVEKEHPDLVDRLTKNFGFSMGIEFRDNTISIAHGCSAIAKKGMVFNVNIGLTGLINKEAQNSKGKAVALFIGDTVIVGEVC
jgi:nucleosome binding factor SPN SPT16 subunit